MGLARATTAVLLLAAALVPAAAAELELRDARLTAEARPLGFRSTWSDAGATRSGEGDLDRAWAAGGGVRWGFGASGRPHRLVIGAEALYLEQASGDLHGRGALLRGECGYAGVLGDRLLATLLPVLGAGPLHLRRSPASGADASLDGWGVEAGLRAGLRWSLGRRWGLGAEAGWLWWRQDAGDGAGRLTLRGDGPWASLALAWSVDPDPRPLE